MTSLLSMKRTFVSALVASLLLSGCAQWQEDKTYRVPQSRIAQADLPEPQARADEYNELTEPMVGGFQSLTPLRQQRLQLQSQLQLASHFPARGELTLAAEQMPIEVLIHTVFGDLLGVNYVIADDIAALQQPVSLQLQKPVTQRELFSLVSQLLIDRSITITERERVYYLHQFDPARQSSAAMGFGRRPSDVPQMPGRITQIVPVLYNRDLSIERVLRELTNVRIEEVQGQSAYSMQGERHEILRAIELLDILDTPAARSRHVGLLRLTYISVDEFTKKLNELLASEGLPVDVGRAGNRNMAIIPLEQIGALALFAADVLYIERVQYWASQLDQPSQGAERRYFIYHPQFARASDLGQSVAALLGQDRRGSQSRDTQSAQPQSSENQANVRQGSGGTRDAGSNVRVENDDMMMTVDERSNSIIFYSTGQRYQHLLPMIKRLDVMPRQILLEATIAEVTLTDEFAMGLEFAIRNGNLGYGTIGAFKTAEIGGLSLGYASGLDRVLANLVASDSRVNVLSSPSIVVRDGVSATISVGSDIPTVGSTTINPGTDTQSTTIEYRKTGVELTVTPTISAQGLVMMEIDQKISNTVDGGIQVAGSPSFFDRAIKTEVIAQSGQSVLLGGLMSENQTQSKTKVPILGDIPGLGVLFRSSNQTTTKTELVILITPRVIDETAQWLQIRDKLSQQLQLLQLTDENSGN